jgi:hypothetical protein
LSNGKELIGFQLPPMIEREYTLPDCIHKREYSKLVDTKKRVIQLFV